jgi:putative ABC transport system permease protein
VPRAGHARDARRSGHRHARDVRRIAAARESVRRELRALPSTIRKSSRSLRRAPGFVAIATLSLGAALGLSTSVFALIDSMRHPESPYSEVDQLYMVQLGLSFMFGPDRHDVEDAIAGLRGVAAHASARYKYEQVEFNDGGERRGILYTRGDFFGVLGVRPRIGHLWNDDDRARGDVAIVTDALWRRRFGNRDRVDGAKLAVGEYQYKVIAVMPPRTEFASTMYGQDIWIPDAGLDTTGTGIPVVRITGGTADTVLVQSQLNELCKRWTAQFLTPRQRPFASRLISLRPDPLALKDYHLAMIGAAVCVLLIACANVAALMLARGMVRTRDYALRLALGAGRAEIAREVIVEVALLAVVGCVAGALIASWAVGVITRATPLELRWEGFVEPQWSIRVFATGAAAVLVSIAISAGFPAWRASRTDPAGPLKESSGGAIGRAGTRFRWLVMAELALAMTLVMGTSLMLKSSVRMAAYDFGYDARILIAADASIERHIIFNGTRYTLNKDTLTDESLIRLNAEVLSRIRAIPGVESAVKFTGCGMRTGAVTSDRTIEGGAAAFVPQHCNASSAGLFHTLGIPMVDGRDFIEGDDATGVIILSQRTAHQLYPHERAVGRMVKLGNDTSKVPWLPIVGVVRDHELYLNPFPEAGPDTSGQLYAMLPSARTDLGQIIVRPARGASGIEIATWRVLRTSLPPHSIWHVAPWVEGYSEGVRGEQFLSLLFGLLGVVSLALGEAGLFSVISYIAGQRNREFAVRVALGATKQNVLSLVMKEALIMALGGTAVGAGLGMWAGFLLWNRMWGVYPVDAQALIAGEATLLVVTMLACLLPALRATRADPVDVLRAT